MYETLGLIDYKLLALILVLSFSYICTDISFQQYNKQLSQQ
ncbi:hypothetical protein BMG_5704 (plasmid) [Priestia megaterium]|nr:hypothetical protein BMG_5704 [Priestia megaterium]